VIVTRRAGRAVPRSFAAASVAALGLVLSGCGSIGIHPGSAAVVGDQSFSMNTIDSTTSDFCEAFVPQIQASSTKQVPMQVLRGFVAGGLAMRAIGQQLADQYDVQPGPDYAQSLSQVDKQFAGVSPSARKAVDDVEGGRVYLQAIQIAVGQKLLAAANQSSGDTKAALQRGQVATQEWVADHKFALDPALGLKVAGGTFTPSYNPTSYAVSTLAKQGAAQATSQNADADYAGSLTPAQNCG
jgi:hypothetical protein